MRPLIHRGAFRNSIGETGLKYFVSDAVALTVGFNYSWSSDDVFGGESDAKNIKLGIRAYF